MTLETNFKALNNLFPFFRNRLFGETNILVREPALEIINYIQNSDFNKPALRSDNKLYSEFRFKQTCSQVR